MSIAPGSYVTTATRVGPSTTPKPPAAALFYASAGQWGPADTPFLCRNLNELAAALVPAAPAGSSFTELYAFTVAVCDANGIDAPTLASFDASLTSFAAAFAEGVDRIYVKRIAGPAAARASLVLVDGDDDPAFTVHALYPGEVGNVFTVAVAAGTTSGIKVTIDAIDELLPAPIVIDNVENNEVKGAIENHPVLKNFLTVTTGAALGDAEVAAAAPLVGGDSDLGGLFSSFDNVSAAFGFPLELGAGAVIDLSGFAAGSLFGNTPADAADSVESFATMLIETRRIGLLSLYIDGSTAAENIENLETQAERRQAVIDELVDRHGAEAAAELLSPLGVFVGNTERIGVITGNTVLVPGSALAAGTRARAIAEVGPHQAPAGIHGISVDNTAVHVGEANTPAPTDAVHAAIHAAGANTIRRVAGSTRLYGWRSVAPDGSDWASLTARDVVNDISADADLRTEEVPFTFVDGKGHAFARLEGILTAVAEERLVKGALYPGIDDDTGEQLDPGYIVDTSTGVNTPQTIAAGQIIGILGVRPSPTASVVLITVRKAAVGGPI